ncbi:MAG: glutathione binding-like protein [Pseudomonadales bacterium]
MRLVLTQGVPGPWSESAKALFDIKGIAYEPVAQIGGGPNEELVGWIRHRNAPIALLDEEPPRSSWLEILFLAERLAPEPRLLPKDIDQRMLVIGLASEICSPGGFCWQARLLMMSGQAERAAEHPEKFPMLKDYQYSPEAVAAALDILQPQLARLAAQLQAQAQRGSSWLVGDSPTAVDIYWVFFSQLLRPFPDEICPMPGFLRKSYEMLEPLLDTPPAEILFEHRDRVLHSHIRLPLSF